VSWDTPLLVEDSTNPRFVRYGWFRDSFSKKLCGRVLLGALRRVSIEEEAEG